MPDYRLNGVNPLAYMGVRPSTPPQSIINNNPPTTSDGVGYALGTLWTVPNGQPVDANDTWVLTGASQGVFTWTKLEQHLAATETFTGNTGGPVGPDAAQNINLVGTGNIVVTGTPVNNTLTISRSGGGGFIGLINKIYLTTPGSGSYIKPSNLVQLQVECIGGGGGTCGIVYEDAGTGGVGSDGLSGGGSYCAKLYATSSLSASEPYTVGAGGAAGSPPGAPPMGFSVGYGLGGNGGDTTFSSGPTLITAGGGETSQAEDHPSTTIAGQGGIASGGDININGFGFNEVSTPNGPVAGSYLVASNATLSGYAPLGFSFPLYGSASYGGTAVAGSYDYYVGKSGASYPGYGGGCTGSVVTTYGPEAPKGSVNGANGGSGIIILTEYLS